MNVLLLVSNKNYVDSNCYMHQLVKQFKILENVTIAEYDNDNYLKYDPKHFHKNVVLLQQRKIKQGLSKLSKWYSDCAITIYDQDPWEAFRDDSPNKDCYFEFIKFLNINKVCVTSQWWADFLNQKGIKSEFVRIWVLPEYCQNPKSFKLRKNLIGFTGSVWSYRKKFLDELENMNIHVNVDSTPKQYSKFLNSLQDISVYIYTAALEISVENKIIDLKQSLWAKDIDALSQGCFVLRDYHKDYSTFIDSQIKTHLMYESIEQIPAILDELTKKDQEELFFMQNETVNFMQKNNFWIDTVKKLLS